MFIHVGNYKFPELIQENSPNGRRYLLPTGERFSSVTTILSSFNKEGLDIWRKRVGEEEANRVGRNAAKRGTAVHELIEKYLKNETIPRFGIMPNVKNCFLKIKPELNKLNNIHCLETRLFSTELKIAGTVDCIAEHDGVLSVIDFKSSIKVKEDDHIKGYYMQGAAYAAMFYERTGIKVEKMVIMIGVDESNYGQAMIKNPWDHLDDLKDCIDNYYTNRGN